MQALVGTATQAADAGSPELGNAVRAYQKHQRWTGELDDDGETYAEGAPEVARQMRETARNLESLAGSWERRAQAVVPR
jgi:hypothetical protein